MPLPHVSQRNWITSGFPGKPATPGVSFNRKSQAIAVRPHPCRDSAHRHADPKSHGGGGGRSACPTECLIPVSSMTPPPAPEHQAHGWLRSAFRQGTSSVLVRTPVTWKCLKYADFNDYDPIVRTFVFRTSTA